MNGSAHLLMLSYWINDNDDEWTRLVCGRWYECEHQVGCKWVTKLQVLDFLKGVFVGWCNRSVLNYGLVKLGCWLGWDTSRLRWSGLDVWIMVGPGWWVGVALRWVLVWVFICQMGSVGDLVDGLCNGLWRWVNMMRMVMALVAAVRDLRKGLGWVCGV